MQDRLIHIIFKTTILLAFHLSFLAVSFLLVFSNSDFVLHLWFFYNSFGYTRFVWKVSGIFFFLTWLYVAACSHRTWLVEDDVTFKTSTCHMQSIIQARFVFFVDPCWMTASATYSKWLNSSMPWNFVLDWRNLVQRRWDCFAKYESQCRIYQQAE